MKKRNRFYKVLSLLVTLTMLCGMTVTAVAAADDEYLPAGDEIETIETDEATTDPVEDAVEPTAESTEEVAEPTTEPAEEVPAENETEPAEEVEPVDEAEPEPAEESAAEDEAETTDNTESVTETLYEVPTTADVWDGTVATGFDSGNGEKDTPYVIKTGAQLAYLAQQVNASTEVVYEDTYFRLDNDIDLNAKAWTPIGGASTMTNGVPGGGAFGGVFDGNHKTIYNLNVTGDTSGYGGYGLFGSIKGGALLDLTLSGGTVNMGTNNVDCVGAFVGYTTGDIYNCHNVGVTVSVQGAQASMAGGIAGTVENNSNTAVYVQYCSNTANVTGRGRVGGIVGAVYCSNAGGIVVDSCVNKNNTLTTVGTSTRSYLGGIVGYCRGYITNCYCYNSNIETSGGHYQAGLAGLMQGASPMAQASNCYTSVTFGTNANTNYDHYLFGTVDSSSTMPLANLLWVATSGTITQPTATATNKWGLWTKVGNFNGSSTTEATVNTTTGTIVESVNALTLLNSTSTLITSSASDTELPARAFQANAFAQDATTNGGYPYLRWEANTKLIPAHPKTPAGPSAATTVYLNGTAADGGDGTAAKPFNNLNEALEEANGGTIMISGTVTLDAGNYNYSNLFQRAEGFTGVMFYVSTSSASGIVTFTSATIDGGGKGTVFEVAKGQLRLRGGVSIENSSDVVEKWSPVTAVEVMRGAQLEINYATIKANVAVRLDSEVTASDDTFVLENYSTIILDGEIVLDYNTYVTVKDSTLPCNLTIRTLCADEGAIFLKGSTGTTQSVTYAYPLSLSAGTTANTLTWQNVRVVYLSNGSSGDGTSTNPYTTIASAASDVENNGGYIAVIGTVNIANNSHNRDVLIKRGTGFTGTMIQSNARNATAQLHDLVIDGGGVGTIFSCNAANSTLILDTNVMLLNCVTAVNAANGNVSIRSAYINASQYSVYMGASSGTLTLTPSETGPKTEIYGSIYLADGKVVTVNASLSYLGNVILVVPANTANGTTVAQCADSGIASTSRLWLCVSQYGTYPLLSGSNLVIG